MRRTGLIVEFCLLYAGLPLLFLLFRLPGHKVFWLGLMTILCLLILRGQGLSPAAIATQGGRPDLRALVLRVIAAGLCITLLVLMLHPERFLEFPRSRPAFWLVVVCLYPLLSALPQEIVYRVFLFRRYEPLFGNGAAMVWASSVSFAFLHIMYENLLAVALSLVGGWLFSRAYRKCGSLFWVSVEHAAYGLLVFSLGLGRYFYNGPGH
ncbi:MAG: CPBP family intramembrane glutamic endopeptidase [Desulfovibrionaceae bacterium]